jgi:hypothetical protein
MVSKTVELASQFGSWMFTVSKAVELASQFVFWMFVA